MENEIAVSFVFYYRAENIGTSDIKDFMAGLKENTSLTELDFSNNCITDRTALGNGIGEILKVSLISLPGNTHYRTPCMPVFFLPINKNLQRKLFRFTPNNEKSCACTV